MEQIIIQLMNQFGYFGVLFLIMIENLFPPIPSELILTFGGFITTKSSLTIVGVVIAATIGSVIGALLLYYIGSYFGLERMQRIAIKTYKYLRVKPEDVVRAKDWFDQKGSIAVLLCRFVPVLRSLISLPAGMAKMKMSLFLLYTTIGSLIWNSVLVYLGFLFGDHYEVIVVFMNQVSSIIVWVLLAFGVILLIWWFKFKKRK